jgi:nicotinamidase-related amidase
MPLTTLDPKSALVVIDLQKGIVTIPTAHPIDPVVQNAAALASAFRDRGLPVVLVNVTGGAPGRTEAVHASHTPPPDWADLVDDLRAAPGDHLVTKQRWGAFQRTSLDADLQALGVSEVVLAGVSTSIGVESTARAAFELGYNVALAVDAMTDRDLGAHENSVQRIFPRLGESATTSEIIQMLEQGS